MGKPARFESHAQTSRNLDHTHHEHEFVPMSAQYAIGGGREVLISISQEMKELICAGQNRSHRKAEAQNLKCLSGVNLTADSLLKFK